MRPIEDDMQEELERLESETDQLRQERIQLYDAIDAYLQALETTGTARLEVLQAALKGVTR